MGPISNHPRGLLDLFGLQTLGNYPREVADVISPVFDLTQLVQSPLIRYQRLFSQTFTAGALGVTGFAFTDGAAQVYVPNNQIWILVAMECFASYFSNAGGAMTVPALRISETIPGGNIAAPIIPTLPVANGQIVATGIAGAYSRPSVFSRSTPWVMRPGNYFNGDTVMPTILPASDTMQYALDIAYVPLGA